MGLSVIGSKWTVSPFSREVLHSVQTVFCLPLSRAELGVAVLDIGAESTSIAVYRRGLLVHTGLLPMGGSALTHQLAAGLRVPMGTAEELLREQGCVHDDALTETDTIEIPGIGGRPPRSLPRQSLVELLGATGRSTGKGITGFGGWTWCAQTQA